MTREYGRAARMPPSKQKNKPKGDAAAPTVEVTTFRCFQEGYVSLQKYAESVDNVGEQVGAHRCGVCYSHRAARLSRAVARLEPPLDGVCDRSAVCCPDACGPCWVVRT